MTSFSINTISLRDALSALHAVIPSKPKRDSLKWVHINAKIDKDDPAAGSLQLTVTDLDVFVNYYLTEDVFVAQSGEFVVPSHILLDYVKSLEEPSVTIRTTDKETILIKEDSTTFEVGTLDVDEYPVFPVLPKVDDTWITLSIDSLYNCFKKVSFSVADKGHVKYGVLDALCLEVSKDKLSFMSTNAHRASLVELDIKSKVDVKKQFLINPKGFALLTRIFSGTVKMCLDFNNYIVFQCDKGQLMLRMIHGKFPPVRDIIPEDYENSLSLVPVEFLNKVMKVSLATGKNSTVKLTLTKGQMNLKSETRDDHRKAEINYKVAYKGDEIKFTLNCKYLLDLLKAVDGQGVMDVLFDENDRPLLFKQADFSHMMVPQG